MANCPKCGAKSCFKNVPDSGFFGCGSTDLHGRFFQSKDCLRNQLRAAEARAEVAIAWHVGGDFRSGTDVVIHKVPQREGPDLYAVRAEGSCLNKEGHWEWEPQPSSRDDEFIARCRFATYDEALEVYKQKAEAEQEGAKTDE